MSDPEQPPEEVEDQPPAEDGEAQPEGEGEEGAEKSIGERIEENPLEMEFMKPYLDLVPEKITLAKIPRINEMRVEWRVGMKVVEDAFSNHIGNMHLDFEKKAKEYESVQAQLEKNLEFLESFYVDMQKTMNEKWDLIKVEKDAWEAEKEEIKELHKIDGEIISLNIGGSNHIQTEKDVLQSVEGSKLAKLFSEMHELKKVNEEVFIDRDGKTFETLVNYLRNSRKVFPEFENKNEENMFHKEVNYWGIDKHNKQWQENFLTKLDKSKLLNESTIVATPMEYKKKPTMFDKNPQKSPYRENKYPEQMMQKQKKAAPQQYQSYPTPPSEDSIRTDQTNLEDDEEIPGVALKAVKDKWNELGPLKLEDIIANSTEPIDQSLQFGQSRHNKFIIGQVNVDGRVFGVGKEINHIIYEGQFKNDIYHGYGRYIYSNGNFYIGNWADGKRSGWGKLVDKSGKTYEGMWQHSKFIGN